MPNTRKNVENCDGSHGENTEDNTNDFNMIIEKKFKTYIISKLTESVKHIIQTDIQGILKGYKDQFEKVTCTVEMFQQHVSNLKRENSVLQGKVKMYRQDFETRCDGSEQYSRRLCLRVENIEK